MLVTGDDASVEDISVSDSTGTGIVIYGDNADVDILINKEFDFQITNEQLNNERKRSLKYLDNSLSE